MEDLELMPFGEYKGWQMQDVPASYLLYMYENKYSELKLYPEVIDYIEDTFDELKFEVNGMLTVEERDNIELGFEEDIDPLDYYDFSDN